MNAPQYLKLWHSYQNPRKLNLVNQNHDIFCKKAVDNLCLKVDMCESTEDYLMEFCEGMEELIELGIPKEKLLNHQLIFSKILHLGSDIVESSNKSRDIFYIGLFIDTKIATCWYKKSFYRMILNMLKLITEKAQNLPEVMKEKIVQLLKVENFPLYALYFDHQALKKAV